jgi:hypothetical protein
MPFCHDSFSVSKVLGILLYGGGVAPTVRAIPGAIKDVPAPLFVSFTSSLRTMYTAVGIYCGEALSLNAAIL